MGNVSIPVTGRPPLLRPEQAAVAGFLILVGIAALAGALNGRVEGSVGVGRG